VCPDRIAVIHGERRFTWADTYARVRRLASALAGRGVTTGDTVAALLANTPEMYEAHFGVPMTGAVLNALNTRLDASAIAFMLQHADAKVLLVDREFSDLAARALNLVERRPLVIDVDDPVYDGPGERRGAVEYEALLSSGDPEYEWQSPSDEWNAISLNYTSGTTGNPKGVVYHHRGAYLNAIANILAWNVPRYPVYLWTLPMFHCNGWCFPWTIAAQTGTNVCLRKVDAAVIFRLIREHQVTHYCCAPIVHNTLLAAPPEFARRDHASRATRWPPVPHRRRRRSRHWSGSTSNSRTPTGSPRCTGRPPCARSRRSGKRSEPNERAVLNGRQGVPYVLGRRRGPRPGAHGTRAGGQRDDGRDHVPREHRMKGYRKNLGHREGVRRRLVPFGRPRRHAPGWLHEGQGSREGHHHFGWRTFRRSRSRTRCIATRSVCRGSRRGAAREVGRDTVRFHRAETERGVTEGEIIEHCRNLLAHFKAPRRVVFGPLPKTATGKIQKFILREQAKSAAAIA
jgi:fatty-acyl-CoA synthase